jgi:hypothetical protein
VDIASAFLRCFDAEGKILAEPPDDAFDLHDVEDRALLGAYERALWQCSVDERSMRAAVSFERYPGTLRVFDLRDDEMLREFKLDACMRAILIEDGARLVVATVGRPDPRIRRRLRSGDRYPERTFRRSRQSRRVARRAEARLELG